MLKTRQSHTFKHHMSGDSGSARGRKFFSINSCPVKNHVKIRIMSELIFDLPTYYQRIPERTILKNRDQKLSHELAIVAESHGDQWLDGSVVFFCVRKVVLDPNSFREL